MYGQNNINPMPDYSDYELWDQYMGNLWQGLIASTGIRHDSTIVEVAPGATAKISQALSHMGFSGRLYIIEPHPEASKIVGEKSRALLPNAEIIPVSNDFREAGIHDAVDAVLANHVFDDFISAYATSGKVNRYILFQDISQESRDVLNILSDTWKALMEDQVALAGIQNQIKHDWQDFIGRLNPTVVILSQYDSSYFDKNDLSVINTHAKDLFQMIKSLCTGKKTNTLVQEILNQNENYRNEWIRTELLDAGNWVIDERQSDP